MKYPTLPKGFSQYGAQMGRRDTINTPEEPTKFHLYQMPLYDGDYDSAGAYWGYVRGQPMWHAYDGDNEMFIRAPNRGEAKAQILETFPKARFYK